jgi:hypothetical protein
MLASIIYNYGKFCDDFKSTLKLGAYILSLPSSKNGHNNSSGVPAAMYKLFQISIMSFYTIY